MKRYQKVLGILIIVMLSGSIILTLLGTFYKQDLMFVVPALLMLPLSGVLTIILMFSYKNRLLIKVVFYGMPVSLLLYFILFSTVHLPFLKPVSLVFFFCLVMVNLVVHFFRNDLNLIVMIFLIITGIIFKRMHWPGAGLILTLSLFLSAVFILIIGVRALRIKDNKYLSGVVFSSCLVLAATCMAYLWKNQHWPGAGFFSTGILPVFILTTLIILLTLPGSNFIEWTRAQKRILLRGILVPWLFFIYIIATTLLIPPYNQFKPFFFLKEDTKAVNFNMQDYEVENRNGLE